MHRFQQPDAAGPRPAAHMLPLAAVTSPGLAPASAGVSLLVALLALVLAVFAFRASRRRSNPGLRWVGAAFVFFVLKNLFSASNVLSHDVPHDVIELVLSLFDLVILLLLLAPLVLRRRRPA